ncbi:MazG family protein [Magnetococcus marinus MC-1]|uniref:Nucleoside triphosphate pyrophosphohydrolase n=1 Tax=Magnetococcus marinus (strain ATCC BAA-1437 / JCM 17883 / MC-1) TaxID=156889 RepID=A0LC99_MAGMM|nr:nucleoside triphosphate pyrophosphohydrolase [Magnetococcus marinus]ABK45592.1 MazG family protein [Magnetococcus marinus MC-1]
MPPKAPNSQDPASLAGHAFTALESLMRQLRAPDGCPWDREQSFQSLLPYTLEEVYEVLHAVETQDHQELKKELGDLLFHIVFYSQIAAEANQFTLEQVVNSVVQKMLHRHPHVFGEESLTSAAEVAANWEDLKKRERQARGEVSEDHSVFAGLSNKLPALLWAKKVQDKMAKVGFDWPDTDGILDKIREEIDELAQARAENDRAGQKEELGDLLFALVNLARRLEIEPETALRACTHKVEARFRYIEAHLQEQGVAVEQASLEEMESLWQQAKKQGL